MSIFLEGLGQDALLEQGANKKKKKCGKLCRPVTKQVCLGLSCTREWQEAVNDRTIVVHGAGKGVVMCVCERCD